MVRDHSLVVGAVIDPIRPKALARPLPVARIQVGKTSGVYAYGVLHRAATLKWDGNR
ncbi:hypothetical protein [Streptomyces sp. NBC_00356]|uniref:hypothetical protein n=1 Tax=Streptomyces sp. NBC_00356 TaxID=2975724 RepID=UPI002E272BC6